MAESSYELREECYEQLSRTMRWLDEHVELMKRKLKVISACSAQLAQSQREAEQTDRPKPDPFPKMEEK